MAKQRTHTARGFGAVTEISSQGPKSRGNRRTCPLTLASQRLSERIHPRKIGSRRSKHWRGDPMRTGPFSRDSPVQAPPEPPIIDEDK